MNPEPETELETVVFQDAAQRDSPPLQTGGGSTDDTASEAAIVGGGSELLTPMRALDEHHPFNLNSLQPGPPTPGGHGIQGAPNPSPALQRAQSGAQALAPGQSHPGIQNTYTLQPDQAQQASQSMMQQQNQLLLNLLQQQQQQQPVLPQFSSFQPQFQFQSSQFQPHSGPQGQANTPGPASGQNQELTKMLAEMQVTMTSMQHTMVQNRSSR